MTDISILIVDDLSFMRMAIREIVENAGFLVAGEATDGKEGVSLYFSLKPNLVLMDITMPVMNGLESLRSIMESDENAKIIMCSAMGQQEYIIKAIQYGAKDFVVKPFRPERIISAIKKAAGIG